MTAPQHQTGPFGDAPRGIDWAEAVPSILDAIDRAPRPSAAHRVVVGITGPAGAGKSTLAAELSLPTGGLVLSTDDYLPDYRDVPEAERDLPEHADLALLAEHLATLRAGEPADVPVWSFHEHRRVDTRRVGPAEGPILLEGLFALHEAIAAVVDVRVFVEASSETRWGRWEAIERRGERGLGVEAARTFFENVAEPTYARSAPAYRGSAHFIVRNEGG